MPRQTHAISIYEQRSVIKRLGGGPIDAVPFFDHLAAPGDNARHSLMRREALGDVSDLTADLLKQLEFDARHAPAGSFLGMADARPFAVEPVGAVRAVE